MLLLTLFGIQLCYQTRDKLSCSLTGILSAESLPLQRTEDAGSKFLAQLEFSLAVACLFCSQPAGQRLSPGLKHPAFSLEIPADLISLTDPGPEFGQSLLQQFIRTAGGWLAVDGRYTPPL